MSGEQTPQISQRTSFRDMVGNMVGRTVAALDSTVGMTNAQQVVEHLKAYSEMHPVVTFLQIGANNGERKDDIIQMFVKNTRYLWRGVMIEPVTAEYEKLKEVFREEEKRGLLNIQQCAASNRDGQAPMYAAAPVGGIVPLEGLESLDPVWLARRVGEVTSRKPSRDLITKIGDVATYTVPSLKRFLTVGDYFDGIYVNAAGLDATIMDQMQSSLMHPNFYIYNHANMTIRQRLGRMSALKEQGYHMKIMNDRFTFAELQ